MNIFDIFKRKDRKEDYFKYIIETNDSECFKFEKKYMNQEEKLLKMYGEAKSFDKKIKMVVIADTHNSLNEEEFKIFINEHPIYDVCLLLGDFGYNDLPIILKYIDKDKIYALLGNHDHNYINEYEFKNLNGNIIDINGVKILGIEGSFKYKPTNFPSFSQKESILFLNDKESVDILVSHDTKFNDKAIKDPAHQGLFGITYYLYKNNVPYHIHGHIHDSYKKKMINNTLEISTFKYEYIEL